MKELIKYSGIIIILIAVVLLAIPYFTGGAITKNTILIVSGALLIIGLIVFIFTNKKTN